MSGILFFSFASCHPLINIVEHQVIDSATETASKMALTLAQKYLTPLHLLVWLQFEQ